MGAAWESNFLRSTMVDFYLYNFNANYNVTITMMQALNVKYYEETRNVKMEEPTLKSLLSYQRDYQHTR